MTSPRPIEVQAEDWESELTRLAADGFDLLDFLTAIDDGMSLRVVVRVKASADGTAAMVVTSIPDADSRLASVTGTYPGAAWHERETREMFGIDFDGLMDDRPLLLTSQVQAPPLRRSEYLVARQEKSWPGAAEAEVASDGRRLGNPSRRRQRPLGVPEDRHGPRGS